MEFTPILPHAEWDFRNVADADIAAVCMWEYAREAYSGDKTRHDAVVREKLARGESLSEWDMVPKDVANALLGAEALQHLFNSDWSPALKNTGTIDYAREFLDLIKWETAVAFEPLSVWRKASIAGEECDRPGSAFDAPAPHRVQIAGFIDLRFRDHQVMEAVKKLVTRLRARTGILESRRDFHPVKGDGTGFPATYVSALAWLAMLRLSAAGMKPASVAEINPYGFQKCAREDFKRCIRWARGIVLWMRTGDERHVAKIAGQKAAKKRKQGGGEQT